MKKKNTLRQYVLTGAALGFYFGWFFRPADDPSLNPTIVTVLLLSSLVTIVTTLMWVLRKQRENLLRRSLITFVSATAVLTVLQSRHFALEMGGRPAVLLLTVGMGALSGYVFSRRGLQ